MRTHLPDGGPADICRHSRTDGAESADVTTANRGPSPEAPAAHPAGTTRSLRPVPSHPVPDADRGVRTVTGIVGGVRHPTRAAPRVIPRFAA